MRKSFMAEQRRLFLVNAAIIIFTIAAMSLVCIYSVAKDLTDDRTFAAGVTVNGLDVSDMTFSDAQRRLERYCEEELSNLTFSLTYNDEVYEYSVVDLGAVVDVANTLERAFNVGKTAEGSGVMGDISLSTELWVNINVDREKLADCIDKIADKLDIPAKDATAEFDKKTHTFTYSDGEPGIVIDREACIDGVERMLASGDFSSFELVSREQQQRTVEDMQANTKRISSFKTYTTANYNRNVNIDLMCQYVNGYVIMPGDVMSINGLVGERTADKGFLEAGAIIDGKLADEVGGGICQLSGTLYNAALYADMEIVERLPHTWPSDYLTPGLDSTLTMEGNVQKDLKIRNTTEYPMYIAAWLENDNLNSANVLRVEIYGQPLPEGMTINLRTEVIETIKPEAAETVYTSSLSSGQRNVVKKERTGYRINAWREYYFDGKLIDSVPIHSSYYPPIRGKVEVGTGGGKAPSYTPPTPQPNVDPLPPPTTPDEDIVQDVDTPDTDGAQYEYEDEQPTNPPEETMNE